MTTPAYPKNFVASLLSGLPTEATVTGLGAKTLAHSVYDHKKSSLGSLYGTGLGGSTLADFPIPSTVAHSSLSSALLSVQTKRKAYFAFRFRDVIRVNNVRNAWCITHPNSSEKRSFYDRSIWGTSRSETDDGLKALMRRGVEYSSVVCVLIGSETWMSRWVRYEIARSVIAGRGLVAVHINGLNHIRRLVPDQRGLNPLDYIGIYQSPDGKYRLCELVWVNTGLRAWSGEWRWQDYQDYKCAVSKPAYVGPVIEGQVRPLSWDTRVHDYILDNGHNNIGSWIDTAAIAVGR